MKFCSHIFLAAVINVAFVTTGVLGHDDIEVELDGMTLATDGRVFASVFGELGIPFFTIDPGFEGDPGVFAFGTTIGFNIVAPLGIWNGDGFDDLNPGPQESLTITFGPASATTGTGFVPGFDFVQDASPGFDVHLGFTLNGAPGLDPVDGIYLLALHLTSNNYDTSETFWIVFDNNMGEEALDAAVDWVQANLIPAPGVLAMLVGAGLAGMRRRRDRRTACG
jgi:hypothetical protein